MKSAIICHDNCMVYQAFTMVSNVEPWCHANVKTYYSDLTIEIFEFI